MVELLFWFLHTVTFSRVKFAYHFSGYGGACNISPRCVETNYHCLYTCLSYCVNLLHVINYLIFDKHGQEFKISNGNNKDNTNQSVNIFSSVTVKRLFCQSLFWIGQSVNQSAPQSVNLRTQIFCRTYFQDSRPN